MARKSTTRKRKPAGTTAKAKAMPVEASAADPSTENKNTGQQQVEVLDEPTDIKTLGKRELIDRVVASSGIKKKAAKPVIEAMLKELGDVLSRGDNLNLHPFGKAIVKTRKSLANAEIVELRLRRSHQALASTVDMPNVEDSQSDGAEAAEDTVAEAAE